MTDYLALKQLFTEASNVLLSLHLVADGDSLGSCLSLKYMLEHHFSCSVTIISADPLSEQLTRIPGSEGVVFTDISEMDLSSFDTLVFTDSSAVDRISHNEFILPSHLRVGCVDHHATSDTSIAASYIDPLAPSTCSQLFRLCTAWNIPLDKTLATLLLIGVTTDSAFFTTQSTATVALREAGELITSGADYQFLLREIYASTPLRLKKYRARVIENLELHGSFGISTVSLSEIAELGISAGEVRAATGVLNGIMECPASCLLTETSSGIKGSFRSVPDIDVATLAQQFGGGGHKNAAGFVLKDMSLDEAKSKILAVVGDFKLI